MKSKDHGVIIVPWIDEDYFAGAGFGFWFMKYLRGPVEVNGKWAFPGGGVETGETPIDAAVREFREETGLDVERARFYSFGPRSVHERVDGSLFYMDYFAVRLFDQEHPKCTEPEKHTPWTVFSLRKPPRPIAPSGEIALGRFLTRGEAWP